MSLCPENHPWRTSYEAYLQLVEDGYNEAIQDAEKMKILQDKFPDADIPKSLRANFIMYWGTHDGWENKKEKKYKGHPQKCINMARTLIDSVEYGRHLVTRDPFAPKLSISVDNKRDVKPVISESEERRNIRTTSLICQISAALMKINSKSFLFENFNEQLKQAIAENTVDQFVESYYAELKNKHPEVFASASNGIFGLPPRNGPVVSVNAEDKRKLWLQKYKNKV
jgi:hypothetical protein